MAKKTPEEYPEGHDVVVQADYICPSCGHDNAKLYADGHWHCYGQGCGKTGSVSGDLPASAPSKAKATEVGLLSPGVDGFKLSKTNGKRKITTKTASKIGLFEADYKGQPVRVYPYYDKQGNLANQKLRLPGKEFVVLKAPDAPKLQDCQVFGHHVWGDKFDRQVIITEGEEDMAAVAQATDFKTAVVSLTSGASSARKQLQADYLWLDRFDDIVLWFDNDEAGKAAAPECADLFKVGKVRIAVTPEGYKDASDLVQADKPGDIQSVIYTAQKWKPRGIVNAAENREDVMKPKEEDSAFAYSWPWKQLDDFFGPMLPGQMVVDVAGTGVGKTTFIYHVLEGLNKQGAKVGFFSFEGTRREIKMGILTVVNGKRIDLEPLEDEAMGKLHDKFFGSGLVEMFDPETAEWGMEAIEGYLRYAAKALDCTVMFIDPLSFLVAGMDQNADERRGLDLVSRNLAGMAKELGIHIHVSHHLSRPSMGPGHEEGAPTSLNQIRGSGGIAAFASIVMGHERNQQAPGDDCLLTQVRGLKNRPRSRTGPIMVLEYGLETGRLTPTNKPFPKPGTKGDKDAKGAREAFGPTSDDY